MSQSNAQEHQFVFAVSSRRACHVKSSMRPTQLLALLLAAGTAASCSHPKTPRADRTELRDPKVATSIRPLVTASPSLPLCPDAGVAPLIPSSHTGHHKVILSWEASVPSSAFESKAVGYCLYRSKSQKLAKQNPTCNHCERINSRPIIATGCVDDLVEDGADYYYVVAAIGASGTISSSSNETAARIPRTKESSKSVPASSHPACREPAAQQ